MDKILSFCYIFSSYKLILINVEKKGTVKDIRMIFWNNYPKKSCHNKEFVFTISIQEYHQQNNNWKIDGLRNPFCTVEN